MKQKGFTLIELLVVISIIGLLASVVLVSLNGARVKSRDLKRKTDLKQIRTALDLYYYDNGNKYPAAGACAYGTNCYIVSTQGSAIWFPALAPYMAKIPVDPINSPGAPWVLGNLLYSYGNVATDGQVYDLTTQLENTSDPDRCGVKKYTFYFDNQQWCGPYTTQLYEDSPNSP